ncbi:MAG: amidohydrolase family protein [Chloroflexota bacterium]|nr:amidohydrolase family protein [Chloroflexota bacterium]
MFDALGIQGALVSSAPDEGTFRLRTVLGARVTPLLGPYRDSSDVFSWTRDGSVLPYLEATYRASVHKGFGEFHLSSGQVALPVVKGALAFARRNSLFLHVHADARALAELLDAVGPDYVVLWAHAGVTATPEQVDALLTAWPRIWTDLSLRDDVAPNGQLDPGWRALFSKYPDRFIVGTDTWTVGGNFTGNERWDSYAELVREIRAGLGQLPPDVAAKLAHVNAERFVALFP